MSNPITMVEALYQNVATPLNSIRKLVNTCPDDAWTCADDGVTFWQHAYHALIGVPFWLRLTDDDFAWPDFHCEDAALMRPNPKPVITREQMLSYLDDCDAVAKRCCDAMTDAQLLEPHEFLGKPNTWAERWFGQVRHIQHHIGVMNNMLHRHANKTVEWQ